MEKRTRRAFFGVVAAAAVAKPLVSAAEVRTPRFDDGPFEAALAKAERDIARMAKPGTTVTVELDEASLMRALARELPTYMRIR